ncbi:hypothetical protein [Mycobacteroides franklinii]|uniref:hypothetical protein n=1 Tax=Mycobacteroides franklinii TaxID=948102 RepID=UPI000991FCFC|nr:hypothetical protein [Mycobacteroides franklinii]
MKSTERAQMVLLSETLSAEVGELRRRIDIAEQNWEQRRQRCSSEKETPERLLRLYRQLEEAEQLLNSLAAWGARRRVKQASS